MSSGTHAASALADLRELLSTPLPTEPTRARLLARAIVHLEGIVSAEVEAEHQRLADAAERLVASLDPDYVGDLPDALDALEVALRDRVRHVDLGAVARSA